MLTLKMWNNSQGFTVQGSDVALASVVKMVSKGLQVSEQITIQISDEVRGVSAEATFDCLPLKVESITDWLLYIVSAQQHGDQ